MKLSVIIPVYNLENHISAALDSLLDGDYPFDYEIIVVDDGSTDRSGSILKEYSRTHRQIRVIRLENGGVSNARNIGVRSAEGEYITFADGDDNVESGFLTAAVGELETGGYDFVQGNFRIVGKGKTETIRSGRGDRVLSDDREMLACFFGPKKSVFNSVWGKVYRAELVRKNAFDASLRASEDQKFVFDLLRSARKIKLLDMIGYDYRLREDSAMLSMDKSKAGDMRKVLAYCIENTAYPEIRALIDAEDLDVLFYLYHDSVLRGDDGDALYREIVGKDCGGLKQALRTKTRLKIMLLRLNRKGYDRLLKKLTAVRL